MSAGTYRMVCEQGATFERVFTLTDESSQPLDLSGFTARMDVRPEVDSNEIYLTLTTENGRLAIVDNVLTVSISAEETATIPEDGVYDIELIAEDDTVTRLLKGTFKLDPEVTR